MGRKVSLSSLAGQKVEDVPGTSTPTLVRLAPARIAATPLNPRTNFGTSDELAELGESMRVRQLQPIVVVARAAYLRLWPEHAEHLGAADYVLANGERRYRSALQVGLDALDALIRGEVADSREAFLDAVLSENIDRKNFDPIEEAHAVEAMVAECGSAKAAAQRFRRHETWVSQRRALLKLTHELQERVRAGALPVRIARSIASLPPEHQKTAWEETRARQAEEAQQRAADKRTRAVQDSGPASGLPAPCRSEEAGQPSAEPNGTASAKQPVFTTVKTGVPSSDQASGTGPAERAVFTVVKTEGPDRSQQDGSEAPSMAAIPWQSPEALAVLIRQRVAPQHIATLVDLLSAQ